MKTKKKRETGRQRKNRVVTQSNQQRSERIMEIMRRRKATANQKEN